MTFTNPVALLLLFVALPVVCYIGWPRSRFRRRRDGLSLALRIIILTLLIFALSGTQIIRATDRLAVVFLLDSSDSMGTQLQAAGLNFIEQSIAELRPEDEAGIVVFAEDAQIARNMSNSREVGPIRTAPERGNTDYAAAIRLALAMLPQDAERRIVILSDGRPTIGDWEAAAQLAAAGNVEISYVPFTRPPSPEVLVRSVNVPGVLNEDQEFTLTTTIYSEEPTTAGLTILVSGEVIARQDVELEAGENVFPLRLRSGISGFRDFEVRVEPHGEDGFYQNNQLAAFSRVEGTPRVLLVDGSRGEVNEILYIVPALNDAGLEVDVITPQNIPATLDGLADYRSVILANVSATILPPQRLRNLETYVRDLGGGLVVIGGPESYGPGGYYQTALEDALPVEMRLQDQERVPSLTIAYVIDRSGSMNLRTPSGITWLDVAKEAIIRSVDFLQPTDRAGIVGFDTSAFWIAEFQNVRDRVALQQLVATLSAGGGTSIRVGMDLAAQEIVNEPSNLKHIIVLTDGGAAREGLPELTEELYERYGVTTTAISIGDWFASFMPEMAERGGGNYHEVVDADQIPLIFSAETVLATRTYIQERDFTPLQRNHPIMQGIGGVPALRGYVATTARPAATVILQAPEPEEDPILAAWQYGLGRSVAFTSDATARWGQNWVNWDGFPQLWSQAVRWTITEGASANLETRITSTDGRATVTVNARNDDGGFLNGLNLSASVVYAPDGTARRVPLRQVAPGRYEGAFRPVGEGAYLIRVGTETTDDETPAYTQTTGWVQGYSREYDTRPPENDVLAEIAELTGGANISGQPAAALSPTATASRARSPIWPFLLIAAVALLPFDVAARRLLITRSDLARFREWLQSRRPTPVIQTTERLSSLKEARERARAATVTSDEPPLTRPPITTQPPTSQPAAQPRYESSPPPSSAVPPASGENIGARLLKKRRGSD